MSNCEHNKRNEEKLEGTVLYLLEIRASKLCHQWTGFEQSRQTEPRGPEKGQGFREISNIVN